MILVEAQVVDGETGNSRTLRDGALPKARIRQRLVLVCFSACFLLLVASVRYAAYVGKPVASGDCLAVASGCRTLCKVPIMGADAGAGARGAKKTRYY